MKAITLVSAQADNVLGEYNHRLEFPADLDFVIIYGPNGVGKTKFLEIIDGVSRQDGRALSKLPFTTASLRYSDDSVLDVTNLSRATPAGVGEREISRGLTFVLRRPNTDSEEWRYIADGTEEWLIDNTPWRPINSELWEDRTDGEIAPLGELRERYDRESAPAPVAPPTFREFNALVHSRLIETQRLRIEHKATQKRFALRPFGARPKAPSRIAEHAQKMRLLVNEAQTEHSRITQQLDRTFPNRILEASFVGKPVADSEVRKRYNQQNEFRSRLGRVVSVALEDALSLPDRDLLDWELKLLNLYLDDADKKLGPFENLLHKIELLEEIINSRLLNKRLQVTAGDGLKVLHARTGHPIELDSLSSGEQHEIILIFELLFNVPTGALVLIDEPEISLHVVWQLAFIPDVQRIAELAEFRFIVATHSPQIINDLWERAVRLGPTEVAFS